MTDRYGRSVVDLASPAVDAFPITPSDSTVFTQPTRFLYVGTAGDVHVRFAKTGNEMLYQAVPAGTYLRIRVDMVFASATTANALVGEY